jgi:hypothetical protein
MALAFTQFLFAASNPYFAIEVVDQDSGRGVPLVELKTVNNISLWTDSAGLIAFNEPGLMGEEVYFHIQSPGYEYLKDFFNYRGIKLRCKPGGQAQIKLKRAQVAERLYRITGAGIYRDSELLGRSIPLKHPNLNGQVMGQDTVIAAPYKDKLYWFWGDTERVSYPLGNFGASGATSELPAGGGLDPSIGIDLTYFVAKDGFSKPMCPNSEFGEGLKWIEGVATLRSGNKEQLVARVAAGAGLQKTREWHLAIFNDSKQIFESAAKWDVHDGHDSSHPFQIVNDGTNYLYLFPDFRVPANVAAMRDLKNYEAYTCIAAEGRVDKNDNKIDRDASGAVRYSWKRGADRLGNHLIHQLLKEGDLKEAETSLFTKDIETSESIEIRRGSVAWNEYRKRWIMIFASKPGEVWYSEAEAPIGPWLKSRRIAVHGQYNFYNPVHHPFFDQEGGKIIYFEGTYTESFSGARAKTPRYDYNQIMYRVRLDQPLLDAK